MKLYAWQPQGHGDPSFFVMAESIEAATAAVEAQIKVDKATYNIDCYGWGTDYYVLNIADAGVVLMNDNS